MRRVWRESGATIAVVVSIGIVVVLCLMAGTTSGAALRTRHDPRFPTGRMLIRHAMVDAVVRADRALYVALGQGPSGDDLLERLGPADGHVFARRGLASYFDGAVAFDGSLWLVSTSYAHRAETSALWRLDPSTLAVESHVALPGSAGTANIVQPLAVVGPRLWLAYGDRLVQIDPSTGTLGAARRIAKAKELGIIAGPGDRTIVLSAGNGGGRGWIQTRDATTGAFLATTRNYWGVTQPQLGGVFGERLWITEATGMMGYAQAVSLRTMRPLRAPAVPRITTNGVAVRVAGRTLIVSQEAGGAARNYCGSPVTGGARLALPAGVRRGGVLAATPARIYYRAPSLAGAVGGSLMSAPIPTACR